MLSTLPNVESSAAVAVFDVGERPLGWFADLDLALRLALVSVYADRVVY